MIGQTISHYQVLEKLGEGGMGVVYKAEDNRLKRTVALKFLASSLTSDPEARKCFIHEAQAASALDHPNICTIHEIHETDEGQLFIAMAYYLGETLKEKIAKGPTCLQEALHLVRQIGEGLAKAHDKGIVHRDIKPANLMVVDRRLIKILDFGVAEFHHSSPLSGPGFLVGTPAYMSPEQASGKPVDQRSDIWSVGVVFYELLTAHRPFAGENDSRLIDCILHECPWPIEKFLGAASAPIKRAVEKMLAKDPKDRYQSLYEFLDDLESYEKKTASSDTRVTAAPQPAVPSIAILPFVDLSAAKDQEYFCDGLAEEIMDDLARLKGLRVASRNATFQFKGRNADILKIGKSLNVQKVLEGSIRKGGNRIRIAVRLINASNGFLTWADEYERELADIFAIQDEISSAVVKNLQLQFGGAIGGACGPGSARHYTENVEAYSHYLRGRFYWNKRTTESIQSAVRHFKAAIQIDSDYALAYSGLADAHIVLCLYGRVAPAEGMPRAMEAAQQALRIDEWLPEAHISLGCAKAVYQWKWQEAEQSFLRGIELKPDYAGAHHWYAINLLTPLGRFEQAVREAQSALEQEPFSLAIHAAVGLVYYFSRRYEDAIKHFRQALDKDPDFPANQFFLGQVYVQQARYQEALDCFQQAMKIDSDNTNMRATYAHAAAAFGKTAEARSLLEDLLTLAKKQYVSAYDIASVYLGLGEKETALSWLEKAADERAYLLSYLKVDPFMDRLREEKRFQAVREKIMGQAAVR
ncbi:MAG TPA: protein kinase [bacterium]|nr:protein kinase [bacterium]HPN35616.1 protein kinase [bacterium]